MQFEMAGLHLKCNKRLFFIGTLYITLIAGVCLILSLSSMSKFVSFSSSIIRPTTNGMCINNVNDVVFDAKVNPYQDSNESLHTKSWRWVKSKTVVSCGFQKLDRFQVKNLLNGSWVVVAGDSQGRCFFASFLEQIFESKRIKWVHEFESKRSISRRIEDYRIVVDETWIKLDFIWARFETNLSKVVGEFKRNRHFPDILVMGSGPWHMLYKHNVSDYGVGLRSLRNSIVSLPKVGDDTRTMMRSMSRDRATHMIWLEMPVFINEKIHREERRKKMNDHAWLAYYEEVIRSKLLKQYGGGPFLFLDLSPLSRSCGPECTSDGLHYDEVLYEAAAQTMLNTLLVESREKL